jgi:squalene-associated FAD-dependent desaturase
MMTSAEPVAELARPGNRPPHVAIIGGGLAGLAAAAALGSSGFRVTVLEARPFLGGRATSYPLSQDGGPVFTIDNCQHILLRCCTNLLDFYRRLGVEDRIEFHKEFFWIEPGGRISVMKRGVLPAPLHLTESFARLHFLSLKDKLDIGRAMIAGKSEFKSRTDLDRISMLAWLQEKKQGPTAIARFWRQVLVSAINEELDQMAAHHGLQVCWLGFLARSDSYQMGVPNVPLADLYSEDVWSRLPSVSIRHRASVESVRFDGDSISCVIASGEAIEADAVVSAVPFERVAALFPNLRLDLSAFHHSPITGIHLWFDRAVTDLPHATLLDRTIQWMYNKEGGRHLQLVVSASRALVDMPRGEVIDLAVRELAEFFSQVREARIERAHVVKEVRATFSATPGLEEKRPFASTPIPNLFLAGDWTRSGWPATMEGAVRSGYLAAYAVNNTFGGQCRPFLLPDLA